MDGLEKIVAKDWSYRLISVILWVLLAVMDSELGLSVSLAIFSLLLALTFYRLRLGRRKSLSLVILAAYAFTLAYSYMYYSIPEQKIGEWFPVILWVGMLASGCFFVVQLLSWKSLTPGARRGARDRSSGGAQGQG